VNQFCLLQWAWISLLLPLGGLIVLTWDFLVSTDMPVLVLLLIWNLILSYSSFGIAATFVYITRLGRRRLDLILDMLNLTAKFPVPVMILVGYITRPGTNKFCFNR
jgi:hypothetical protein